ncbi:MAG: hypothetical protein ICV76_02825 [Nitrospiraceae bacterium]|nr:hypothetical protein [Nitrospiraceae bacterium]
MADVYDASYPTASPSDRQTNGQLADNTSYTLDVTIVRIDSDAVVLSYAGRIGTRTFPSQGMKMPLVAGQPVRLNLTGDEGEGAMPPLYVAWESSVKVISGEMAILMIGQRSEEDAKPKGSHLPLILVSFL